MSNLKIKETPDNGFGVIMKNSNNEIKQIGLTESEYQLFEAFLGMLSQQKKLLVLPKEYDLKLVNDKDLQNSPYLGKDIHPDYRNDYKLNENGVYVYNDEE